MQVSCPHCRRVLEYSGDPPVFCAYCGRPLGAPAPAAPAPEPGAGLDSGSETVPAARPDPRLAATALFTPPPGGGEGSGAGSHVAALADSTEHDRGSGADETAMVPPSRGGRRGQGGEPDPEQVADYRIVRLLGRGGMGSVYEAEDRALGRRVALKLIGADHVASSEAVERFRQEGRLASTIAHPRCVFVLGADEHQGRPYIVMELMPGETLQNLIDRRGPLPVGEAIAKVLDVIDGLQEAHLQGVIHRDVKPSNCFLEADGRVKVGDFGLSKSLDDDAGLTRTGSFVGTPLYASPEQIKRDSVDERTDVYSVAATLYFLLTGRPPFQGGDAAAVLARIVSEEPDPMREHRPEVPPALELAIRRGMDRDRDRRFADLGRLRDALLPFVSENVTLADQALRVSAYLADSLILWGLHALFLIGAAAWLGQAKVFDPEIGGFAPQAVGMLWRRLTFLLYFALSEGPWGASPGKRLTRLRVGRAEQSWGGPPGIHRALFRAFVLYLLTALPGDAATAWLVLTAARRPVVSLDLLGYGLVGVGVLAMVSTMRASNGYRGLHEFATGTRLVRLPRPARRRVPRGRRPTPRHLPERAWPALAGASGVLRSVGPFSVRGAVRWDGDRRVLLGEDPGLGRSVWLVLRPRGAPAPSAARRDLGRPGRPRWLGGGEQGEYRWDAYAPQLGCSLADLAGPDGLPWADARPLLHDLADELARACVDGTLPEALSVEQVWIQPDGTVQLVDPLEPSPAGSGSGPGTGSGTGTGSGSGLLPRSVVTGGDPRERALELLRRAAAMALEGGRRRSGAGSPEAIRAAVPLHAGRALDRLLGRPRPGDTPYADVAAFIADLEADRDKPTEVDLARRAAHLVPAAAVWMLWLLPLLTLTFPGTGPRLRTWPALLLLPLAFTIWGGLTRGGLLMRLSGLALVRHDSRPAGRRRCAVRALLPWLPLTALLAAALALRTTSWPANLASWAFWGLSLLLLLGYFALGLLYPARAPHDRLAGTWLVPR